MINVEASSYPHSENRHDTTFENDIDARLHSMNMPFSTATTTKSLIDFWETN